MRPSLSPKDHFLGPRGAPITLIVYGDYQCPFSGRAYVEVSGVLKRRGDDVRLVYRHFPLSRSHPYARLAACAAEAAAAQGHFWPMHAMLYEHQPAHDPMSLRRYAHILHLDTDRFLRDLEEPVFGEKVNDDYLSGVRAGVTSTPVVFINGVRAPQWDRDSLLATIADTLRPSRSP